MLIKQQNTEEITSLLLTESLYNFDKNQSVFNSVLKFNSFFYNQNWLFNEKLCKKVIHRLIPVWILLILHIKIGKIVI